MADRYDTERERTTGRWEDRGRESGRDFGNERYGERGSRDEFERERRHPGGGYGYEGGRHDDFGRNRENFGRENYGQYQGRENFERENYNRGDWRREPERGDFNTRGDWGRQG